MRYIRPLILSCVAACHGVQGIPKAAPLTDGALGSPGHDSTAAYEADE